MKNYVLLFCLIGAVACSSVKVGFDYDKQVDFTKYSTYKLLPYNLKESVGELNRDRILKALESELAAKGFTKSDNPDALIDILIKGRQEVSATATTTGGYGYHRYGYGGGFSTTTIDYNEYIVGTMFITLVDNESQKIVWQGTGEKTINEDASMEKREQNITYAIQQILSNYPPAPK